MEITEVRIFSRETADRKLKAYATITFDNVFVVRNLRVIEGSNGLFVAMPSRRMKESCSKCGAKNDLRSKFCNQCGAALHAPTAGSPETLRETHGGEHKDIAHPITQKFREYLQKKVLDAYEQERRREPAPAESVSGRTEAAAPAAAEAPPVSEPVNEPPSELPVSEPVNEPPGELPVSEPEKKEEEGPAGMGFTGA